LNPNSEKQIGIIDYKNGNTQSVVNAISHLGFRNLRCTKKEEIDACSHIILPGVGAFSECMSGLNDAHLTEPLTENVIGQKKPFLGICVGMQILIDTGSEFGEHPGLGWVSGRCDIVNFGQGEAYLLPHVGWNEITRQNGDTLFQDITGTPTFYFVHSYVVTLSEKIEGAAYTSYGTELLVALKKGNIYGVQFHPEKSQKHGLQLLKNFCELPSK